jgi:hypothetical protein
VTVPPASSTSARFCSNVWQRRRLRAPILRKRLPKRSTVICAVATGYVKSNITRLCAPWYSRIPAAICRSC